MPRVSVSYQGSASAIPFVTRNLTPLQGQFFSNRRSPTSDLAEMIS
jgi:hypothetical protein